MAQILEAAARFELAHKGFADLCLTTWLRRPREGWIQRENFTRGSPFGQGAVHSKWPLPPQAGARRGRDDKRDGELLTPFQGTERGIQGEFSGIRICLGKNEQGFSLLRAKRAAIPSDIQPFMV